MSRTFHRRLLTALVVALSFSVLPTITHADHSWGSYHWSRTSNPFILKLGDNVSGAWDSYLATASSVWNSPTSSWPTMQSTTIVAGKASKPRTCRPTSGRVEVCATTYGNNGWLGVASIWISGSHITAGTVKLNDTYYNTATYNTPAWRNLVMCQEIGHTFGLDHQDENFSNANLGTCMDYTNDPSTNQHPNQHDYDMLETIYSAHLDAFLSAFSKTSPAAADDIDASDPKEWGTVVRKSSDGRSSLHERDLGKGKKLFTFVIWAD